MKANIKRGFNRLFAVLTAAWVLYCLFVYGSGVDSRLIREGKSSVSSD
jgi:hypothetical protein